MRILGSTRAKATNARPNSTTASARSSANGARRATTRRKRGAAAPSAAGSQATGRAPTPATALPQVTATATAARPLTSTTRRPFTVTATAEPSGPLVPGAAAQREVHHRQHDRHLDEDADHGRERRARLEAEQSDRRGDRQFEEIRRADQRRRAGDA